MPNIILECNKIWKKIGSKVILNNFSSTLYEGDVLGLIGPNGAGKTTLMKIILGLQSFNGGSVSICGYDIKKSFTKAIRNTGAVIEVPDLYMYLTGYENLKLSAKIYNIKDERIKEVIKLVGLENSEHEKVKKYSLGMRQRLGIAQAILHNPRLLILDEPMNGLDPNGVKDLKVLLDHLAKEEKMAIIISSHILSELETICNRICIISKGNVIQDKEINEIKKITEKNVYTLEVSNTSLDKILYNYKVVDNNTIQLTATKSSINNIIKTLLLNDICIYEIRKEKQTLEELFLSIMKDKNDKIN